MNPDEQHEEYYQRNPQGNHDMYASMETKKLISDLRLEMVQKIEEHAKDDEIVHSEIWTELRGKVDWDKFIWVLGIFGAAIFTVLGIIYVRQEKIIEDVNEYGKSNSQISEAVSWIKDKINNAEITK